nr:MAG TPA: hypothetical protein [Caudoviricetes sp.]
MPFCLLKSSKDSISVFVSIVAMLCYMGQSCCFLHTLRFS